MTFKEAKARVIEILKEHGAIIPDIPPKPDFAKYADVPELMKLVRKRFAQEIGLFRKFQKQLTVIAKDMVESATIYERKNYNMT